MRVPPKALVTLGLFAVLVWPLICEGAPVLYGITFTNRLVTIDPKTGSGSVVGSLDAVMSPYGLGATGGNLYTFDQHADRLRQIDPDTGATLATVDLHLGDGFVGEGGLDFRSDGTGFIATMEPGFGGVFSFTLNGVGRQVGSAGFVLDGLAFRHDDVLFGLSQGDLEGMTSLYIIDTSNGRGTLIGQTGVRAGTSLGGLDFIGDVLYAVIGHDLYTLDTSTGAATLIGPTGTPLVSGLASLGDPVVVPEPALLGLIVTGLMSTMVRRRMR